MNDVLVLGVGNPLMGDDGFGIAVLDTLRDGWSLPPTVRIEDGGTWGMNLLPMIEDASALLLLDAIDAGHRPGTLIRLERDALPAYCDRKVSPHQVDLREVFAVCALRGTLPARAVALGVQPAAVELGLPMSPAVQEALTPVAALAALVLGGWGHPCRSLPRFAYA